MSEQATETRVEYPEHAKLAAVSDQSQAIGDFLEDGPYELCELVDLGKRTGVDSEPVLEFIPVRKSLQRVLAEWFDIDLDLIEREKQAMLDSLRSGS